MSEKNTVTISTERYDDFKEAVKIANRPRSQSIIIDRSWGSSYTIETDDEVTANLARNIKELIESNQKLKGEVSNLESELSNAKESISIKDMSLMSFIKEKYL